jgi:hypothetical protein
MYYLFILLFLSISINVTCAQQLKLNEKMFEGSKVYYKTSAISTSFQQAVKAKYGISKMADAGQPYSATDVRDDISLPSKRLIFFAAAKGIQLMYYEHGGIGHHYHCITLISNKIYSIDVSFSHYSKFEELKKYLLKNTFKTGGIGCQF